MKISKSSSELIQQESHLIRQLIQFLSDQNQLIGMNYLELMCNPHYHLQIKVMISLISESEIT